MGFSYTCTNKPVKNRSSSVWPRSNLLIIESVLNKIFCRCFLTGTHHWKTFWNYSRVCNNCYIFHKNRHKFCNDKPHEKKPCHREALTIFRGRLTGSRAKLETRGAFTLRYFPSRRHKNDRLNIQRLILERHPFLGGKSCRWRSWWKISSQSKE